MNRYFLMYLISLTIFGSNGIFAAYVQVPSYDVALTRAVLGSISLIAVFFLTKHRLTCWQYKRDMLYLILGGIGLSTNWLFLFEAYAQIGVGLGAVFNYCAPALVILVSPLVLHEKLTAPKLISLFAALIGAVCISGQAVASGVTTWGLFCGVMAAICFAGMVIANRFITHVQGLESVMIQIVVSAVVCLSFLGWKDHFVIPLVSSDILPLFILGTINTGLNYALYFPAIQRLPVQTVAVCGYIEPLSAVFLSLIFLGEWLTPVQWIGAALIIGGAIWCEWHTRRHTS